MGQTFAHWSSPRPLAQRSPLVLPSPIESGPRPSVLLAATGHLSFSDHPVRWRPGILPYRKLRGHGAAFLNAWQVLGRAVPASSELTPALTIWGPRALSLCAWSDASPPLPHGAPGPPFTVTLHSSRDSSFQPFPFAGRSPWSSGCVLGVCRVKTLLLSRKPHAPLTPLPSASLQSRSKAAAGGRPGPGQVRSSSLGVCLLGLEHFPRSPPHALRLCPPVLSCPLAS
ncbi:hypothetical protein HJG60_009834 [Phyllostomus discolor]|uniref:Uncharacterized protein n=1 Tax=Phyllostomus discolor TaxID=89673 RepID=A0A834B6V2_9CHIR|nr:hypothetical protein HJG60_009834 [Phyllostomus discolor]